MSPEDTVTDAQTVTPTEQELAAAAPSARSSGSAAPARCPTATSAASTPRPSRVELRVARLDGKAYATSQLLHPPGLPAQLRQAAVDDGIRCSCHGSVFDLETGEPI